MESEVIIVLKERLEERGLDLVVCGGVECVEGDDCCACIARQIPWRSAGAENAGIVLL